METQHNETAQAKGAKIAEILATAWTQTAELFRSAEIQNDWTAYNQQWAEKRIKAWTKTTEVIRGYTAGSNKTAETNAETVDNWVLRAKQWAILWGNMSEIEGKSAIIAEIMLSIDLDNKIFINDIKRLKLSAGMGIILAKTWIKVADISERWGKDFESTAHARPIAAILLATESTASLEQTSAGFMIRARQLKAFLALLIIKTEELTKLAQAVIKKTDDLEELCPENYFIMTPLSLLNDNKAYTEIIKDAIKQQENDTKR